MTTQDSEVGVSADKRRYRRFLKQAAGTVIGLLVFGYLPTVRLAGDEGIRAMLAGCGVSLVGSVAGTLPLLMSRSRTAAEAMPAVMGSIVLRMASVLALAAVVAAVGAFAIKPFLLWVAFSHVGLLFPDTVYARNQVRLKPEAARKE